MEQTVVINRDNTAQYKFAMLFDKRLEAYMGPEIDKSIEDKKNEGKVDKITRGDYFGYEATKDIKDIEENDIPVLDEGEGMVSFNKDKRFLSIVESNIFRKVYKIDADFNLTSLKTHDSYQKLDPQMADMFSFAFNIKIPEKAKSTNCKNINKETNTYSWDIKFFQSNPIKLEWVVYNYVNISVAVLLVALAVFGLVKFIKKK